jgi:hypothetical protein
MRTHREAIVTSSAGTWSASSTNTVDAGGSSIVFSNAGPAACTRCISVSTSTLRRPSTGDRTASRMISGTSSFTDRNAPCGTNVTTSGCSPASASRQSRHEPHPPVGHSSAAENAIDAARPPAPGFPRSR